MRIPTSPVVLIGNYLPDRQFSMQHYSRMLEQNLQEGGANVTHITPSERLGRLSPGNKWLGYIDKLLLFPFQLKKRLATIESINGKASILHVCDHSNSPLLKGAKGRQSLLTCHDLIAIRAALGEFQGEQIRWSGKILQTRIRKAFPIATRIVCDSKATEQDLHRIDPSTRNRTQVVYNGFNTTYKKQSREIVEEKLKHLALPTAARLILHVGNNAWYKNRLGVLKIFHAFQQIHDKTDVHLIFAGPELDVVQQAFARTHGIEKNIQCTGPITSEQLEALYSIADVFLFPSRHEGFGWPPLEAQSTECPVVASHNGSLAEILGDSGLTANWDDTAAHSRNVQRILSDSKLRNSLVSKGLKNANRFSSSAMTEAFCQIYCEMEEFSTSKPR